MPFRTLRCAVESLAEWHQHMFLEPHIVAFTAVTSRYAAAPARFDVVCEGVVSRWLKDASRFNLEVSWNEETEEKAKRLRATIQPKPLVEFASVAIALILSDRVVRLGPLDVTQYGDRADYRAPRAKRVLEISGTETVSELGRRHREKIAQALKNPFGWGAYVVVSGFSARGHRVRFSSCLVEDTPGGKTES
jgi:hypothetical protein